MGLEINLSRPTAGAEIWAFISASVQLQLLPLLKGRLIPITDMIIMNNIHCDDVINTLPGPIVYAGWFFFFSPPPHPPPHYGPYNSLTLCFNKNLTLIRQIGCDICFWWIFIKIFTCFCLATYYLNISWCCKAKKVNLVINCISFKDSMGICKCQ